jgi:cyclohexadienyl dehydratase
MHSRFRGCVAACMVFALTGGAAAATPTPELYTLLRERLALMPAVAAYKWHAGHPVEDLPRERQVVAEAVREGLRVGLTAESSARLFDAQIDAAKAVQRHWFAVWRAGETAPPAPDLAVVLRPQLLDLGARVIAAAAVATPHHDRERLADAISMPGLADEHVDALFAAVTSLATYPDRLRQVIGSGVLRVGTTGDYAPFSYTDTAGETIGIDVDLARQLALALDVRVALVKTSWPTLLEDLAGGHFDIAMSGISRTLDRQRHGYLSPPYHVGGKAPIARCSDRDALSSLADIDRPGVRVVVNPGGTNQQFVDTHIHQADKRVHADNRTIFAELIAGRADVMITDRIEVALQTARHPELCATMAGNLTYQEKAYLLPQDDRWLAFVATWLSLALADGSVEAAFHAHGVAPALPGRAAAVH